MTLEEQIQKELNLYIKSEMVFNIEIKEDFGTFVEFWLDGFKNIIHSVRLTKTGKVKRNSYRTEANYSN